jgi:two-component system cell cycle response regulator DivK
MSKTILIVEDNELNMRLFNDLLQANGYNTVKSVDGSDAIDLTRENMPDLIIMDIQLPGMSGMEITELLKADEDLKHIPVIAVTAFAMKGDEDKIMQAGFASYIAKPVSVPSFLENVSKLLEPDI